MGPRLQRGHFIVKILQKELGAGFLLLMVAKVLKLQLNTVTNDTDSAAI